MWNHFPNQVAYKLYEYGYYMNMGQSVVNKSVNMPNPQNGQVFHQSQQDTGQPIAK